MFKNKKKTHFLSLKFVDVKMYVSSSATTRLLQQLRHKLRQKAQGLTQRWLFKDGEGKGKFISERHHSRLLICSTGNYPLKLTDLYLFPGIYCISLCYICYVDFSQWTLPNLTRWAFKPAGWGSSFTVTPQNVSRF